MNFLQNHLIFRQPERVLYPKCNTQKTPKNRSNPYYYYYYYGFGADEKYFNI
ncbi:MAG: hypothetical protein J6V99_07670 [Neisseriaceae bacterium]|nr:hypothetical protein [Neisseriaceae bacterium]